VNPVKDQRGPISGHHRLAPEHREVNWLISDLQVSYMLLDMFVLGGFMRQSSFFAVLQHLHTYEVLFETLPCLV